MMNIIWNTSQRKKKNVSRNMFRKLATLRAV